MLTLTISNCMLPIVLSVFLVLLMYKYSTRNHDYWKKRGVPFVKPTPLFGNFLNVFLFRTTVGFKLAELYKQFNSEPYFGLFTSDRPILVIRSPEIIKSILITNFNCFPDRNFVCDKNIDQISSEFLSFLKNAEWKERRPILTPFFSLTRIKYMIPLMDKVANNMLFYIENKIGNADVDAKHLVMRFSTDVMASCAFGIDGRCFEEENSHLYLVGKRLFASTIMNSFSQTCYIISPKLVRLFKLTFFSAEVNKYAKEVFRKILNNRNKSSQTRNDLTDILNQIGKDAGKVDSESIRDVALALFVFAAGVEVSGLLLTFALYELALNPLIQENLRKELTQNLSEDEDITYDKLQKLKYLDSVVAETARIHPAVPFSERVCLQDFKIPNTNLVIESGTPVFIPTYGIHYDPEHYPNPEVFDPDRFNVKKDTKNCFLTFGAGPRSCIGVKFSITEAKIALAKIILHFKVEKATNTTDKIKFANNGILLLPEGGLPVRFKKLRR